MKLQLTLLFTAFLVAVPAPASTLPERDGLGITMPLTRRATLVDEDGVVKLDRLGAQLVRLSSKVNRGMKAFEKNTGYHHPCYIASAEEDDLSSSQLQPRKTGTVPLSQFQEALWYGEIYVGTPRKKFTVDFDTGSGDLFLPGEKCTLNCQGHVVYIANASSTSRNQFKSFEMKFGDSSSVQGEIYTDVVTVGGLKAVRQGVGAATQYSDGFDSTVFPPDGIMGMGFPEISAFGVSPVFQTLIAQGKPTLPQFSFKFANEGSELFLGGVNRRMFKGDFHFLPLTQVGFWQVTMDAINVGKTPVIKSKQSAIDTGTSVIVGPEDQVKQFYSAIPSSKDASVTGGIGFFTVPCNSIPSVSLTFGGKDFPIPPDLFNLGRLSSGSEDCVGAVIALPESRLDNMWIVGDTFLRTVYTTFDVGRRRVGFATLA